MSGERTNEIGNSGVEAFNIIDTITDDWTVPNESPRTLGHSIQIDASSNDVDLLLPDQSSANVQYFIKRIDASGFNVTVNGNSEEIDNSATPVAMAPGDSFALQILRPGGYVYIF